MEEGAKNRAVGAHNVNEHSSRSHLVVSVWVRGSGVGGNSLALLLFLIPSLPGAACRLPEGIRLTTPNQAASCISLTWQALSALAKQMQRANV